MLLAGIAPASRFSPPRFCLYSYCFPFLLLFTSFQGCPRRLCASHPPWALLPECSRHSQLASGPTVVGTGSPQHHLFFLLCCFLLYLLQLLHFCITTHGPFLPLHFTRMCFNICKLSCHALIVIFMLIPIHFVY